MVAKLHQLVVPGLPYFLHKNQMYGLAKLFALNIWFQQHVKFSGGVVIIFKHCI